MNNGCNVNEPDETRMDDGWTMDGRWMDDGWTMDEPRRELS